MTIGSFFHHFILTCSYIHCLLVNAWKQTNSILYYQQLTAKQFYTVLYTHKTHLFLHVRLLILQSIVESVKLPGLCQCSRNCRQTHTNTHTYMEVDHTNTNTHTHTHTYITYTQQLHTTTHFSMPISFCSHLACRAQWISSGIETVQFLMALHLSCAEVELSHDFFEPELQQQHKPNFTKPNQY